LTVHLDFQLLARPPYSTAARVYNNLYYFVTGKMNKSQLCTTFKANTVLSATDPLSPLALRMIASYGKDFPATNNYFLAKMDRYVCYTDSFTSYRDYSANYKDISVSYNTLYI
jgi:hypothetical protein